VETLGNIGYHWCHYYLFMYANICMGFQWGFFDLPYFNKYQITGMAACGTFIEGV